jgi:CRP/FNR family transcriptional regulator, anaerobic regulatory protein
MGRMAWQFDDQQLFTWIAAIARSGIARSARAAKLTNSRLEQIKYYRSYQAGQTVIWSGDRMDFVASVVTGIATLTQTMEDGRRQMVGLLLPSDFVGRPGRGTAAYDVTATTDLVMCCFRKKPFEEMMLNPAHRAAFAGNDAGRTGCGARMDAAAGAQDRARKDRSLLAIIARRDASCNCAGQGRGVRPAADA